MADLVPITPVKRPADTEAIFRACDAGDGAQCGRLGLIALGEPKERLDDIEAATLFAAGCDRGDRDSCWRLGVMFETGKRGVKRDLEAATRIYGQDCGGAMEREACAARAAFSVEQRSR